MDITRLSYSTVSEYGDCGEKVRLKKVERVKPVPAYALAGGSGVHEVTANLDLLDFGVPVEGPTTFEDAFEIELSQLEEETDTPREKFRASGKATNANPYKENLQWWKANGPIFVENWRRFLRQSPYQIALTPTLDPAIEIAVSGEIGGAPVKGYIDRVLEDLHGNLFVVDLKSGVRKPKPKQLLVYRILLSQVFEGEWSPDYGFYYMNRSGLMTDPVNLALLDDGATEHEYRNAWTGIQAGVFIPNTTSGWCSSCEVAQFCYANEGLLSHDYRPYRKDTA